MKHRVMSGWMAAALAFMAGCASFTVPPEMDNPTSIALTNYETVWETTIHVLEKYFQIGYENRYDGRIETRPVMAATLFEPWRADSVGCRQRLEATLQTIRRRGFVIIHPSTDGGFQVVVEVYKELEDLPRPIGQRVVGGTFFQSIQPVQQEIITSSVTPGAGWISLGRDKALESKIIQDIQRELDRLDIQSHQINSTFKWPWKLHGTD